MVMLGGRLAEVVVDKVDVIEIVCENICVFCCLC